jgi:membrane carboxypeptidase/penicillin-binding protein PbpC
MRATADCPSLEEWFLPGTAPIAVCDWHRSGAVVWPTEYVEWAAQTGQTNTSTAFAPTRPPSTALQIVSPRPGDRYQIPAGIDRRYATIAFRVAGANAESVRWFIDGHPVADARWMLVPGRHVVRVVAATGASDEARFEVLAGIDIPAARR